MNSSAKRVLQHAFKKALPRDGVGNFAFARFLERHLIEEICGTSVLSIDGWEVYGVISGEPSSGLIQGDRAVELREDKQGNVLLLIDPAASLSGMDGIYSAAFEITEVNFFRIANELALSTIKKEWRKLSKDAVTKARKIGRQNTVSPWEEFTFYVTVGESANHFGQCVALLGLWPFHCSGVPEESDLDNSMRLVEKLLLATGAAKTPAMRVSGLSLKDSTNDQVKDLEDFVRNASSKGWRDAVHELQEQPSLWLHSIRPALFDSEVLHSLELVKWRARADTKPATWSGLSLDPAHDGLASIAINLTPSSAKERTKLEVRWKAIPEGLRAGAVEYNVSVVAGDDLLAEQRIVHSLKEPQKAKFTEDDFSELEEGSTFEARIVIRVVGNETLEELNTEDFILTIGKPIGVDIKGGAGQEIRCLAEGLATLPVDDLQTALQTLATTGPKADKRGYLIYKVGSKSFRVRRPKIFAEIESNWLRQDGKLGRWSITVGPDGSRIGAPQFLPLERGDNPQSAWSRINDATASLCKTYSQNHSFLMNVIRSSKQADEYVNAWLAAFETADRELLLANTLDVRSVSGKSIGLIVLPMHALRLAWHYAYDSLVLHSTHEEGMAPKLVENVFSQINGSQYPFILPGFEDGAYFVFGDMLSFFFPAMLDADDPEPKASIALLARAISDDTQDMAPAIGGATSEFLAKEVRRYISLHPTYHNLHVTALKAGDGRLVSTALGKSLVSDGSDELDEYTMYPDKGFTLRLLSSQSASAITGAYLLKTSEKRRAGAGGSVKNDRWMLESYAPYKGVTLPRLKWARLLAEEQVTPTHISMSFDAFASKVKLFPITDTLQTMPLEVYGLVAPVRRDFKFQPHPVWFTYLATTGEGDKNPAGKVLTDRLVKMHLAIVKSSSRTQDQDEGFPVLSTELGSEDEDRLMRLHDLSDWVVTIDRNGGIEYFDSPQDARRTYDSYVIDCVPERPALGTMQLVTSTSRLDELTHLLSMPLIDMGLSCSPRNSEFLLEHLKGLSGKLAMKLANTSQQPGELVALSLVYANCLNPTDESWVDLRDGFFVPLDDVPELCPDSRAATNAGEKALRADLVYVMAPKRGGLQFAFIECKYRRYLKTSRSADLLQMIEAQLNSTSSFWDKEFFFPTGTDIEVNIKRHILSRILKFYASKARRHYLQPDCFARIEREIDKFAVQGKRYQVSRLPDRGFIFCSESFSAEPDQLVHDGTSLIFLFGPNQLPDLPSSYPPPAGRKEQDETGYSVAELAELTQPLSKEVSNEAVEESVRDCLLDESPSFNPKTVVHESGLGMSQPFDILLGTSLSAEPAFWKPSTTTNPHLMLVGVPGMGKTTSLISITKQVVEQGGSPIVFSYHEDFDARVREFIPPESIHLVDFNGLGFNPLQVVSPENPLAYLDNASNVRDIFAAVFPELGDLQVERIREAIKSSYQELAGFEQAGTISPPFQRFFDILREQEKPSTGLIARLSELNDYGFFKSSTNLRSVLNANGLTLVRLHKTNNENLQRAFASFVLYNIYQEMFVRGPQSRLLNAVIFDEAHKASKLRLLGTMGKECRKFGIALLVASQELKDFHQSLFAAISNYMFLRLSDADARIGAKMIAPSELVPRIGDRLKALEPWHAYFNSDVRRPQVIKLTSNEKD